ncbi:MAG: phosphate ABC transporter permease PstA [Clostridium sp.]|nr:phosphate ABC transporter permease PstA [Clostridium sp.]
MRKIRECFLKVLLWGSIVITLGMLIFILSYIFIKGIKVLSFDFLLKDYSPLGDGGVMPMVITTLYMVGLSILVSTPIAILAAIYLQEYAKQGKLVKTIRFATECLSGIPSIVYGLFGAVFFVEYLNMGYSIIAGALTVSIIILPVIIRTTEESLKSVPNAYKEGSLGLGATRLQTLYKVVVPSAVPGILAGTILAIGRVIGESAAILLTAGTVAKVPKSIFSSGRTLTVQAYLVTKEAGAINEACAVGIILIVIVFLLNTLARYISRKINKANY